MSTERRFARNYCHCGPCLGSRNSFHSWVNILARPPVRAIPSNKLTAHFSYRSRESLSEVWNRGARFSSHQSCLTLLQLKWLLTEERYEKDSNGPTEYDTVFYNSLSNNATLRGATERPTGRRRKAIIIMGKATAIRNTLSFAAFPFMYLRLI